MRFSWDVGLKKPRPILLCSFQDRVNELGQQVSSFGQKLEMQRVQLSEARQQFLNSGLIKVERENDELRQSVRIADNELRIMLHEQQVGLRPK